MTCHELYEPCELFLSASEAYVMRVYALREASFFGLDCLTLGHCAMCACFFHCCYDVATCVCEC